jgi:hypothetical protein
MTNNLIVNSNQADTLPLVQNTITKEIGLGQALVNDKLNFRLHIHSGVYDPYAQLGLITTNTQVSPYNAKPIESSNLFNLTNLQYNFTIGKYPVYQQHIPRRKGFSKFKIESMRMDLKTLSGQGVENFTTTPFIKVYYLKDTTNTLLVDQLLPFYDYNQISGTPDQKYFIVNGDPNNLSSVMGYALPDYTLSLNDDLNSYIYLVNEANNCDFIAVFDITIIYLP